MAYFRQIASARTGRFSYLLADMGRRDALVIDPADDQVVLYLSLLAEIRAKLTVILLTHRHGALPEGVVGLAAATAAPVRSAAGEEGLPLGDGESIAFGDEHLVVMHTPGHSPDSVCYLWRDKLFTGDTLLIDDCCATEDTAGDSGILFDSLARRLLTLPDETLVYPGRLATGRQVSSIGEQRQRNPCLAGVTRDEFIAVQEQRRAVMPPLNQPPSFRRTPS